jgi:hypothetical protein
MAALLGKIPTTSARRLISPFSGSGGWVECHLARCYWGKVMQASTSGSVSSIRTASVGTLGRSWSATRRH